MKSRLRYELVRLCLVTIAAPSGAESASGQSAPKTGDAAQQQDTSGWRRRAAGTGDSQTVAELSGRLELGKYFGLGGGAATLRGVCDMKAEAEEFAVGVYEGQLADFDAGKRDRTTLASALAAHIALGQLSAYRGDMATSIEHLEAAYEIAASPELGADGKAARLELEEMLGVAEMRRGEMENCMHDRNADRCIFPVAGGGRHENPDGATRAAAYFTKYLEKNPSNLDVRWLLNLASQTLGQYPDKVPKQFLIPPAAFESKERVGRFTDVAPSLGLDAVGISGGTIVDDFDNDGLLDVVFSSVDSCEPIHLYHNDGDGKFTDRTAAAKLAEQLGGINCCQTDYDNDGWLDLFVSDYQPTVTETARWYLGLPPQVETLELYRNDGKGGFVDVTAKVGLDRVVPSMGANFGDIDNDGFLDIYLGKATKVSKLEVFWPGSKTWSTTTDLAANQAVELREGDPAVTKRTLRSFTIAPAPSSPNHAMHH